MSEPKVLVMPETRLCPACSAALPADAPMGLCAPCLFNSCLGGQTADASRFGDYELLDAGREGGMGVVYRARQIKLDRIVALKMIRGGFLTSPARIQRFRAEAEAAASLDHPHIVPIHEVGEHEGRYYFTMKWLDGGNLAQALQLRSCRREEALIDRGIQNAEGEKKSAPPQIGCYPPREAASLLAIVARAVHHAHQRGIIHRDLKPSNILLDAEGQPHVSDFGLAKRLESDAAITLSGDVLGTPGYMAPEQAAGKARDVTTAADIYSLGAILYELLTGEPPFAAATPAATMHKVLTEEPKRPSTLGPTIPSDLETICLKCLEKEPPRRYASSEELAEDLDRWLRGEPTLAQPSGIWLRASKWARRKPAIAALTIALAFTALAGSVAAFWQLRQTEQARRRADASTSQLREALSRYLSLLAEQPILRPDNPLQPRQELQLREELLQTTVSFLENFTRLQSADPALERQRGLAYLGLSRIEPTESAITNAQQAVVIFQALAKLSPGSAQRESDLATAELALGGFLVRTLQFPVAEQTLSLAHARWRRLVAESPKDLGYRRQLANTCNRLSDLFGGQNRPKQALEVQQEGLAVRESLVADFPTVWQERLNLAIDYNSLALALARDSLATNAAPAQPANDRSIPLTQDPVQRNQAQQAFRKAIKNYEELVSERPEDRDARDRFAGACWNFGNMLVAMDQASDALPIYEQALSHYEALAMRFPQNSAYQVRIGSIRGKTENLRSQTLKQ